MYIKYSGNKQYIYATVFPVCFLYAISLQKEYTSDLQIKIKINNPGYSGKNFREKVYLFFYFPGNIYVKMQRNYAPFMYRIPIHNNCENIMHIPRKKWHLQISVISLRMYSRMFIHFLVLVTRYVWKRLQRPEGLGL